MTRAERERKLGRLRDWRRRFEEGDLEEPVYINLSGEEVVAFLDVLDETGSQKTIQRQSDVARVERFVRAHYPDQWRTPLIDGIMRALWLETDDPPDENTATVCAEGDEG